MEKVNTENLREGMIIKNYPKMCELLGEKEKNGGKSKVCQLERWKRFFDYDIVGHSFYIKEIRKIPLPQNFRKNDVFSKDIHIILVRYLLENNVIEANLTINRILEMCGFVNHNYKNSRKSLIKFCEEDGCSNKQAFYYFNKINQHIKEYFSTAIKNSLERLTKKNMLIAQKRYMVKQIEDNIVRISNTAETNLIEKCINEIRKENEFKSINSYNEHKFYQTINRELVSQGFTVEYQTYNIKLGEYYNYLDIANSDNNYIIKKKINEKCLEQMHKCLKKDIEKQIEKDNEKAKINEEDYKYILQEFPQLINENGDEERIYDKKYEFIQMLYIKLVEFYIKI